nr:MAG TPA: tail assembly chaperone protein [Caudoviricetes sp.]
MFRGYRGIYFLILIIMTITINNKEYKLKYTIRALFIFE